MPATDCPPLERHRILPEPELPDVNTVLDAGRRRGEAIQPTRSAFLTHYNVDSEAEYKRRRMAENAIMFHAQIGYRDVEKTRRACAEIYESLDRQGYRVDRFGITFDRNMGYPPALREERPKGTGLILNSIKDWEAISSSAPVASHYADFMIGLPASVENTAAALTVGATNVGNLSHFYNYRLLYHDDEVERAAATIEAMAMMSAQPHEVSVSSNVDDGFGSLFVDIACTLGLVLVEQHLVEKLIGVRHVSVFGNTFANPFNRTVFQRALSKITTNIGPMVYGATTLYGSDEIANHASLSHYLCFDIAAQRLRPTGHAVTAVPVTEYERIPDIDEIIEAQTIANRLAELGESSSMLLDEELLENESDKLITAARRFKHNLFRGLENAGIDTDNPLELLLSLRRIGARELERRFGPGPFDPDEINSHKAVFVSENMAQLHELSDSVIKHLPATTRQRIRESGLLGCIATSDVHEYGKIVLEQVCKQLDVTLTDAGTSADPDTVAKAAYDSKADFVALSTYNGIALTYLQSLRGSIERLNLNIPIFVGGRINQIPESSNTSLPVDVSDKVRALGVVVCKDMTDMLERLAKTTPDRDRRDSAKAAQRVSH